MALLTFGLGSCITLADLRWYPDPPQAGATLAVAVAAEQRLSGREVLLHDPDGERELGRFRFGRFPAADIRFDIPVGTRALILELREDGDVLSRHPASGQISVEPADTPEPRDRFPAKTATCSALPPEKREALTPWIAICPLVNAALVARDLRGVDLAERDLRRADLRNSDLSDASFRHADLSGASLAGARLDGADFAGASLSLADLHGASLFVADLDGANLRNADLRGADLSHASLSNADLSGARTDGATLAGADFTAAVCPDGTRVAKSCRAHLELP